MGRILVLPVRSVLLGLLAVFQISAHWIILAEERWCRQQFGAPHIRYREKVGRYF